MDPLLSVGLVAIVAVLALATLAIMLAISIGRGSPARAATEAMTRMADRVCIEHESQLQRLEMESKAGVAHDHLATERHRARMNGTARPAPRQEPDIQVPDDTTT